MNVRPATIILAPGQTGTYSGLPATVVRQYDGDMYEIRVPGGLTCIDASDFLLNASTITIQITCNTGKTWTTRFNGSLAEAKRYFGNATFVDEDDNGAETSHKFASVSLVHPVH